VRFVIDVRDLTSRSQVPGRYGIALALVSIVATSSIFVTMQAGAALRGELDLQGRAAKLIYEYSRREVFDHLLARSRSGIGAGASSSSSALTALRRATCSPRSRSPSS
jgi:hypothetical protein